MEVNEVNLGWFACVNCGERGATEGSFKHPYCIDCWNKLWKGREEEYDKWLNCHNTVSGMLWYKKNILNQRLNLWDRFLLLFCGGGEGGEEK